MNSINKTNLDVYSLKRHEAIQPLSRDHYVGLTLAMRLLRGKPDNLKSNWPPNDEPKLQAKQAMKIFDSDLYYHFKDEEEILFNKVDQFLVNSKGKSVFQEILDQHKKLYKLFEEFDQGSTETIKQRMAYTGELLEKHVRLEERDLFPLIEGNTPEKELTKIGIELRQRERFDCSTLL